MRMKIDKPRCENQPCRVNVDGAGQRFIRYGSDFVAGDTDISNRIQIRLGIQDPSVAEHQIEVARLCLRGGWERITGTGGD